MGSRYCLTNDTFGTDWMEGHQIEARRTASLGDPAKYNGEAYNAISRAHTALAEGLGTIAALVKDPIRTEVQKHDVAKKVADSVTATLEKSVSVFHGVARNLNTEATEAVQNAFAIDEKRTSIHSEIRGWIRETAKTEGGLATIRRELAKSAELVGVLFHSPHYLIALAEDVRAIMVADGIAKHVPKAGAKMAEADALSELAIRYGHVVTVVRRSFYSPALAEQAKLRVEFA
jgi:hypothetical protein